jgi:uncharacterized membrane-anchored protein YhcB (DUF1043 family)
MTEDQFDDIIRTAADHYNVPPVNPPLDAMWAAIESEAFAPKVVPMTTPRRSLMHSPWLRMAAVLVVGIAVGRLSARQGASSRNLKAQPQPATVADAADAYQLPTERFLGQTVTLFASLPKQLQEGRPDSQLVAKANEQLVTLRMLMDSPAASNPRLRALFEDLELVLVQVVQMPKNGSQSEAKLIRQSMQERDVMPRLVDAVADNNSNF